MSKTIRKTYPRDFSIGILIIIFATVFFLSGQLFAKNQPEESLFSVYLGEFLVSTAVLVMVLILWEEILFPVSIKPHPDGGLTFRNHRTKLKIQALIYLSIPAIILFLYLNYEVSTFRFFGWASVCMLLPVLGKLISGINNYNDFLTFSKDVLSYKDNEKEGSIAFEDISQIEIIKDSDGHLSKLHISLKSAEQVLIDLDKMELDDYYEAIEEYLLEHHREMVLS